MKLIHRKDLNIEDIRTEEYWNRFRIFSILNKEDFDYKLTTNSLVKSCLNSSDTILAELKSFKPDISETRDKEYENLNLRTYMVEYLPLYTHIKLSNQYFNSLLKFRDFKYIDRDTTFFVRIPKQLTTNMEIRKTYEKIQFQSIGNYREIYSTKERNCRKYANYLLPLGVQNRAVLSLNLEDNVDLINSLLCSDLVVENQLGDMFERVLSKEIKITPNSKRREVIIELLQYLEDLVSDKQRKDENFYDFRFKYITDIVEHLITNLERLINPLGSKEELEFDYNDQVHIGKLIKRTSLRNIAISKGSMITGYLSLMHIFQLQSFNYQMYIPFLSDFIDIDKELDRPANKSFLLPTKLDNNPDLKKDIFKRLTNQYRDIKKWREQSKKYMSEEVSKEFTKYLLPAAHVTRFNLYLDIDDIFALRGKEFEYIDHWVKLLYQKDPLFKK